MPGWRHARVSKPVINLDRGGDRPDHHIMCAWDDCELQGYELNKVVINDAAPGYPPRYMRFVFCTERHKYFFVHSHRDYGNLPPGYRMSTI
jgi:hypothetical protein